MGVMGWKTKALNRKQWRSIAEVVKDRSGLQHQIRNTINTMPKVGCSTNRQSTINTKPEVGYSTNRQNTSNTMPEVGYSTNRQSTINTMPEAGCSTNWQSTINTKPEVGYSINKVQSIQWLKWAAVPETKYNKYTKTLTEHHCSLAYLGGCFFSTSYRSSSVKKTSDVYFLIVASICIKASDFFIPFGTWFCSMIVGNSKTIAGN